jgi:hypothetical protein
MSALLQLPFIFLFVSPDGKRVCGSIIIYIRSTEALHYALFCPSLFGWTDSYITQNVCAVRLMLSVAASAAIVIIR